MLRVSCQPSGQPEIFYSLQGEGITAGTPTVFLRLATCNLTCTWCDTKYTWDWQHYDVKREVVALSIEEVEQRVLAFRCRHLVITGGEPLLQQNALAPVAASLKSQGFYCEVETNGTVVPHPALVEAIAQWNVSPKLKNSGTQLDRREVANALVAFRDLANAYFKFVVVESADVDEVCQLVDRYSLSPQRVILLPEGTTPQALALRGRWVAGLCADLGFRFSTRLHILLWGDERGR
jgi:7-carboxy-7-deazaguanine synthase